MTEKTNELWHWLAINGASCAASALPLPDTLRVIPTPEQLIGYRKREAQLAAQRLILTAPIEAVERYMQTLPPKIAAGEIAYIRPQTPEPPTTGQTMWIASPDAKSAENLKTEFEKKGNQSWDGSHRSLTNG